MNRKTPFTLLAVFTAVLAFALVIALPEAASAEGDGTYENLTYEIENSEVTITGYVTPPEGDLVIPETLEGYPVTGIGYYAFHARS